MQDKDGPELTLSVYDELLALVNLAIPSFVYFMSFFALSTIELVMAGHLGTAEMTAVAFCQIIFDFTIIVFTEGFTKGVHSLASQAFGAKNYMLLGRYAQLGCFMLTIVCLPLGCFWWFVGDFLKMFGVAATTIHLAQTYTRLSVMWLWPRITYQLFVVYFAAQENVLPSSIFSLVFVGVNAVANYVLVFGISSWRGLGFVGMPIAMTITMYGRLVTYLVYMMFIKQHHALTWVWSYDFLDMTNLKVIFHVGLPLALGQICENAQLQSMALMASRVGEVALDAHNSMLYLFLLLSSPVSGMATGGIVRIGIHLGAGQARRAKFVWKLLSWSNFVIASVLAIPLLLARNDVGHIFSVDPLVWSAMSEICTLAAVGYVLLSLFYSSMTTLIAQARGVPLLIAFFCGAWLVGVPTAYLLGLKAKMGLLGIWIGMSAGYGVTTAIAFYGCVITDWKGEANRAIERSKDRDVPDEAEPFL
ncbi:unnamed protein product [Aphanomyces euteiches]|uniref:MATE efflux family protein n=1 Tax=Aphanomyces euteiches TaxID=100861 RepID=A0A6G0XRM0_9STRA|nr:hypothetical protein Ae201684_002005 [Aphanomyces euteiches]KAH9087547.1 hypothetical protein Ae201684P_000949 [Aphanomyces euteiches]KAH9143209.1 hypothetical protein AeRB84_012772 [Aphanomyces euteiches]